MSCVKKLFGRGAACLEAECQHSYILLCSMVKFNFRSKMVANPQQMQACFLYRYSVMSAALPVVVMKRISLSTVTARSR